MGHLTHEPDHGEVPPKSARVEDDFESHLSPTRTARNRRLSASLPFAVLSILVVATVAFGATVIRPMVVAPRSSATPVVVGDDPTVAPPVAPTGAPTAAPTAKPTTAPPAKPTAAPTAADAMNLTARLDGRKVVLTWTAYHGEDFAYYKVVRSSNKAASWPLGDGDSLDAAISDKTTLTFTDSPTAGKTWSYEVFAVKPLGAGYVVLNSTNLVTISVPASPKPTPRPTPSCGISLSATVKSGHVQLKWTKYGCDLFEDYVVVRSETNPKLDVPLPHEGTDPMTEIGDINQLTWTDHDVQRGHTYYYRVMVWNSKNFCNGGTVLAKSGVVKVTVPKAATPSPTRTATPAPAASQRG